MAFEISFEEIKFIIPEKENLLVYTENKAYEKNVLGALESMVKMVDINDRKIAAFHIEKILVENEGLPSERFRIIMILEPYRGKLVY